MGLSILVQAFAVRAFLFEVRVLFFCLLWDPERGVVLRNSLLVPLAVEMLHERGSCASGSAVFIHVLGQQSTEILRVATCSAVAHRASTLGILAALQGLGRLRVRAGTQASRKRSLLSRQSPVGNNTNASG